ncbi:hypothetical protein BGW38_004797 [Lunasporangiospora selenospora]|uniref:DUF7514 domain-containing protein n=1 Tax=Lunasporangiospora selenospora TaxID=979761 RepID=A0A9P6FQT0_9FUNG|nr:hypothetical protein BGW38_004797 [Lunasporangiospora selenospora]
MVHQPPLLDHQYNPTETLRSFSNTVFRYLDTHYEPKGTQLLEYEKLQALFVLFALPENENVNRQLSSIYFNTVFLALKIETVFTAHGPAITPAGLLTYLRSEIMNDPEENGFMCFDKANSALRLSPPFVRSQFPRTADPKAVQLQSYIDNNLAKALKDMKWTAAAAYNEELQAVKARIALEQMGQQNALDLLSPRLCYRCYRCPCVCF